MSHNKDASQILSFTLELGQDLDAYLKQTYPWISTFRVISKALDARNTNRRQTPRFHFQIEALAEGGNFSQAQSEFKNFGHIKERPIIIGAGPAGLFAAIRLVEYGLRPIILERGDPANQRMLKIARYWRRGELDPESNVCFGEGGAGLFSDGKLITRIKSEHVPYVMKKFVDFGAPEHVAYVSNPHLGSNKIRQIISKMADYLRAKGVEIHYRARAQELMFDQHKNVEGIKLQDGRIFKSPWVILAVGHSADDVYQHLMDQNVAMALKDFAVGVRIEHRRDYLDKLQFGKFAGNPELGASRYRLSYHHRDSDRGTYSFCMCPGGVILSSGTQADGIVINGMSNNTHNSAWSNSALVVSVKAATDLARTGGVELLRGIEFQRQIERKAYALSKANGSGREIPAMTLGEFMNGQLNDQALPVSSTPSKVFKTSLLDLFPHFVGDHLQRAIQEFERQMKGFADEQALLLAPETRTSSPLTILRDKVSLQSTSHKGLFPCGEGAGYAGGITSSAVDGIRSVEALISSIY